MSNQSRYQAMMGEVHASADLMRKVRGIPMEKTKKRGVALRMATATCAALLGVFVVTNGVCYAATGETWVEKATVWVNGEPVEMDVHMSQNGDVTLGEITYEVADDETGGAVKFSTETEGGEGDGVNIERFEITDYTVTGAPDAAPNADNLILEDAGGHVYLAPGDEVQPIDLTDELRAHGGATGTYEQGGKTYVYQVSGEPGNWHANVEAQ